MGKSVSGIGRGLPLLRENLCVVAAMATDEFLPKLLRRNVPPQLTLDHVSPATRLLEKRRQKIEVQEALEAQKADFSRREEQFWRREQIIKKKDLDLQENLIRFNKFLQENDTKRTRAEKKHIEEEKKKIEYTQQIEKHKEQLDQLRGENENLQGDLGKITTGDHGWWLVVDSALEASGAPVDELDGALGLDGGNGSVHVLGDNVSTVHHATSHVLSVTRIALGHHVGGLEARVGDLGHGERLMVGLLSRDDWRVGRNHEMNTGVGHQVGLELGDVNVEGTIESERSGQGGDHLRDKTVQVGVGRAL